MASSATMIKLGNGTDHFCEENVTAGASAANALEVLRFQPPVGSNYRILYYHRDASIPDLEDWEEIKDKLIPYLSNLEYPLVIMATCNSAYEFDSESGSLIEYLSKQFTNIGFIGFFGKIGSKIKTSVPLPDSNTIYQPGAPEVASYRAMFPVLAHNSKSIEIKWNNPLGLTEFNNDAQQVSLLPSPFNALLAQQNVFNAKSASSIPIQEKRLILR